MLKKQIVLLTAVAALLPNAQSFSQAQGPAAVVPSATPQAAPYDEALARATVSAAAQNASAAESEDENTARAFITDLAARNFEAVEKLFSAQAAGLLPEPKLAQTWDRVVDTVGAFQSISGVKVSPSSGSVVIVTCKFSRSVLDAVLSFDAQHRVDGFRLIPSAETPSTWTAPAYAKPGSFDEKDVTVGTAPWTLPGTLTMPKGAGPFPAVVLVHGSGPNDEDESLGPNKTFKDIAWGLGSRGMAVLRYEKRTHRYGKQMATDSTGLTVRQETIEDARAAVSLLASTPGIGAKHILVAGHSLGGYLAPRIAAGDAQIAGLIVLAGSTRPLEDMVVEQITDQLALANQTNTPEGQQMMARAAADKRAIEDPNLRPGVMLTLAGAQVPSDYFLDLRDYDAVKVASSLKIPMLILQGERDYQVTMTDFDNWQRGLSAMPHVTLKSYPALNHLFLPGSGPSTPTEYNSPGHVESDVIDDIANWVRQQSGN